MSDFGIITCPDTNCLLVESVFPIFIYVSICIIIILLYILLFNIGALYIVEIAMMTLLAKGREGRMQSIYA